MKDHFKSYIDGGNTYILKSKSAWFGFQKSVIDLLKDNFESNFFIVMILDDSNDNDFYAVPFSELEHLFTDKLMTTGKISNRWTAVISNGIFKMKSNNSHAQNIAEYYGLKGKDYSDIELSDYTYIENYKSEINIRIGQSKFRKKVLSNFNNRCALTGIKETDLLRASHIIPWSHNKETRGDYKNGISLFVEIDLYFDKGYISFSDDYQVIISPKIDNFSFQLKKRLLKLKDMKLMSPKKDLKIEYLEYHRNKILIQ